MNTNVKNICEVVEDIKEKLTDCQYKIIMDNLMVLNEKKEETAEDLEEEVDEELEELNRQISFLNVYIPTLTDEELKYSFVRRLDMLRSLFSNR
jgi:DNA-binding transcriptional regulator GbsR (MarR family)